MGNPRKEPGGAYQGKADFRGSENKKALRFFSQDASDRIGSPALSSGFNAVPFFAALFVVGGLFAVSIWRLGRQLGFWLIHAERKGFWWDLVFF